MDVEVTGCVLIKTGKKTQTQNPVFLSLDHVQIQKLLFRGHLWNLAEQQ